MIARLKHIIIPAALLFMIGCLITENGISSYAESGVKIEKEKKKSDMDKYSAFGGGYAATGQIEGVGYTSQIYDASNGLPTSDAMCILGASNGYMWIGSYSGVIRYDGTVFERIDTSNGLTSARALFEDSKGRIWAGTNDNGVVVIDGEESTHFTYKDGLPSSSIRSFSEDDDGNIFIGTTSGVCYVDDTSSIHVIENDIISGERVLRLDKDAAGRIFGQTSDGNIFAIDECKITEVYSSSELHMESISTIMADPFIPGKIYIGTDANYVYYGEFGAKAIDMIKINVNPLAGIHWISHDCNKIWISSINATGYVDGYRFKRINDIGVDSGIEMMTSDYQGNMWYASSTLGVMKIVTNNFVDITSKAGVSAGVTNAILIHDEETYIGTDDGLIILGKNGRKKDNNLTIYLRKARIRCIKEDSDDNIWVATYTHDKGLVCCQPDGNIVTYTEDNGMPSNQIRCVNVTDSGKILAGTNGGLVVIENGKITHTYGPDEGMKNTVILTAEESKEGYIFAGSDGDGIYVVDNSEIRKIDRGSGLTSDVVMRIIRDDEREVFWVITSNSIEFIKDGAISEITTFPYNNNYDLFFDDAGNAWILSSYGLYMVDAEKLLENNIEEYRLYTIANGLPYAITGNSYGDKDDDGNLYLPGRDGAVKVNINNYYEKNEELLVDVKSVFCDKEKIQESEDGSYRIPASDGRIQISVSVMDYTMINPLIQLYLEGGSDEGVVLERSSLLPLEYTNLPYGNYTLHVNVLNSATKEVLQDERFSIIKTPRLFELFIVKMVIVLIISGMAGFIVWRVMRSTVIRNQYDEIRQAKEEAERANTAKTRFLANISHEIRTPINTIMGMNEMIMRENPANVPKGYFLAMMNYAFDIRNASESLLSLINDLLDMSKIESGKMHLVEQEYDTQDMLRSIVSMIRVKANEKGLSFDVVIDEVLPKRLYGDVGKIKQVVINLLTNAVKYTSVGGLCLTVSMDEREDKISVLRFSVKDTGIGVKEEDMEKLFTAYERLDEVKNSAIQGTGLGLDISRRFAELMGGKLWCESVYGEGSEFIFTLNQEIIDETPMGIFIEHDENEASGPYVPKFIAPDADILVVDDNPMNLNVIKGLLKATKVFVTTSESGADAIDKIKDSHFDVVLLDHMMPGLDGIETLEMIREFEPDLPVYALTANAVAGEEFYKSKGFNGYLSKPVDSVSLEKTIMKHLPESMMEKPTVEDAVEELTEIPENMKWLYEVTGLSVDEGIKNSGGVSNYMFSLDLFLDTIDDNSKVIKDAYDSGNIRLYTIKVHALKSSARIVGAEYLAELSANLEDAGNKHDMEFINSYNEELFTEYTSFKEKLARLKSTTATEGTKGIIPEDELRDAYEALKELIPQMDYDSVEMILGSLSEYILPEEDETKIAKLQDMLKRFDWDGMEGII